MVCKNLVQKAAAAGGKDVELTSFGKLIPTGDLGHHGFRFEFPEDHPEHKKTDFQLKISAPGAKDKADKLT